MKLLDGGCADSIPVEAFKKMGYDRLVVVLTREAGFVKKPENVKMAELRYHKYPEFVHTLQNRHVVYNHSLEVLKKMEKAGETFVIQPDKKLDISRMESNVEVIQTDIRSWRQRCTYPHESTESLDGTVTGTE